jgi:hypothetical protein
VTNGNGLVDHKLPFSEDHIEEKMDSIFDVLNRPTADMYID